ncbi:hypothetical protein AN214_00146 [Pseudoalteromonas sp. P1-9]|uniref:hypothetical protein n=1 Tax=Pseudoalteromonas sp. P1-9 TaxID=1710354 RepID=UPI0006D61FFA|nr:hypothetical protein [Pseudoalteromonas sp. P1-9]KPV98385.1 hypothetical protein AN214_00146 [Pseudoalteromonas sp. P1-9]
MNTLDNFLSAQNGYKKLLKVEQQLIKSAVKEYQISELVKQCSEARTARNQQLLALFQSNALGAVTFVGILMIPYLTLMAF